MAKGLAKGGVLALQDVLRTLLVDRFGPLPEALRQQIERVTEVERLRQGVLQASRIASLDELRL